MIRHFLAINDLTASEIKKVLALAIKLKKNPKKWSRNLERMVNIIMARVFEHQKLIDLSRGTKISVVNGLSDWEHPCQAMADILTVWEKKQMILKRLLPEKMLSLCIVCPPIGDMK